MKNPNFIVSINLNIQMKKIVIVILLILSALLNVSADTEKEIRSETKHVTVFPDGAQISEEAAIALTPGKTVLRITGLSPYIDAQSIQVKGVGEFTILSVNHQNNYLQNLEASPEINNIQSQIDALLIKAEDEKTAIEILKEKESFLSANKVFAGKDNSFTAEQFKSMLDLYSSNIEQIRLNILRKNRLIKDYEIQIAALQKQISDKLGAKRLPSGEIAVTVSSEKQITGKITLNYLVSNAGWYPSYDIRVDDITKPVTVYYKANVFQNTGVEWKDVNLSFSNATPSLAGNVPILYPWYVDFYNPVPVMMMDVASKSSMAMAPAMKEEEKSAPANELPEASPVSVVRNAGETSVTFDIAVPYTVASDGKILTVEIQKITTPSVFKYVTVPKLAQIAYLTGNITDWEKQSLLSGEATLYFENTFVGKSMLDVNQQNDTLTISLGNDNNILVKREKRKDFKSTRLIGVNKQVTYSYLITVRNNKANPIRITVNDQIPISSNSSITVEPAELSGGKFNSGTGEVKWDLDINPQENRQLILTYTVKYPKDKNVILE
jgi:uncharacterized protein (TIGR02231 family)